MFSTVQLNPYVPLLAGGIQHADPTLEVTLFERLGLDWWRQNGSRYDILHIHWAELQFSAATEKARWIRFLSFLSAVVLARSKGAGLVYTAHNLTHHEGRHPWQTAVAHRVLFSLSHAVHVHDEAVLLHLRPKLGRHTQPFIIPHGSYVGYYPAEISPSEARAALGIPMDAFVYLMLGGIRPYKGAEELIDAFKGLEGDHVRLVIAGHVHEPAYARSLHQRAGGDARILLHLEHVPDADIQRFMRAADVCVFPYREATTSGAAILALSFERPIIAPTLGPFSLLIRESAGILYDPESPLGLQNALRQAEEMNQEEARLAIRAYLETITWERVGARHAEMYRSIAGTSRGGRHDPR